MPAGGYGQSITPKCYRSTARLAVSKSKFTYLLHTALLSVGMIPARTMCSVPDLENFPEWVPPSGDGDYFNVYDYPTSDTFTLAGLPYRPCVVLQFASYLSTSVGTQYIGMGVCFHHARRRADRQTRNDLYHANSNPSAGLSGDGLNGFGQYNNSVSEAGGSWTSRGGAYVVQDTWLPYEGYSAIAAKNQRRVVNHVFVYLGKGGLWIQVGDGLAPSDQGNAINVAFAFHGARVPGRGRPDGSDPYRDRIDPVMFLPHRSSYSNLSAGANQPGRGFFYNHTYRKPCTFILGMEFTGNEVSTYPTYGQYAYGNMFNISNVDRSRRTSPALDGINLETIQSPRSIAGTPSYVLDPVGFFPHWDAAFGVSPQPYIVDNGVIYSVDRWEDYFYFPGVRMTDRSAVPGPYQDPATSKEWWLLYAHSHRGCYAIDVDDIVISSTLSPPAIQTSTTLLDIATSGINGTYVYGGTLSTYAVHVDTTLSDQRFANVPGQANVDITLSRSGGTSTASGIGLWFPTASQAIGRGYKLQFEAYHRTASSSYNGSTTHVLTVQWWNGIAWQVVFTLTPNTSGDSFNYNPRVTSLVSPTGNPALAAPTYGAYPWPSTAGATGLAFLIQSFTDHTGGNSFTSSVRNINLVEEWT